MVNRINRRSTRLPPNRSGILRQDQHSTFSLPSPRGLLPNEVLQFLRIVDQSLLLPPGTALYPGFHLHGGPLPGKKLPTPDNADRGETAGYLCSSAAAMGSIPLFQILRVARIVAAIGKPQHVNPIERLSLHGALIVQGFYVSAGFPDEPLRLLCTTHPGVPGGAKHMPQ